MGMEGRGVCDDDAEVMEEIRQELQAHGMLYVDMYTQSMFHYSADPRQ